MPRQHQVSTVLASLAQAATLQEVLGVVVTAVSAAAVVVMVVAAASAAVQQAGVRVVVPVAGGVGRQDSQ